MPMETVVRTWTIVTWLLARAHDRLDETVAVIEAAAPDAVALQSVREHDVEQIAAALGHHHAWARSHHPRSRLLPGSAVGLAVLTPHHIGTTVDHVIGEHRSMWSPKRRITQATTTERADHSAYTIHHAVEHLDGSGVPTGAAPLVHVRPAQVGIDNARAIEVPQGATTVAVSVTTPIAGAAPVLAVTFELPWVTGDFPVV